MSENTYWFIFYNDQILLEKNTNGNYTIPFSTIIPINLPQETPIHEITPLNDITCKAVHLKETYFENSRYIPIGLRASYDMLPHELYLKAGKAFEILYWDENTQFCSRCGAPMQLHTPISKRCTACGREVWPAISTAIIVRITRNDEILLVHARNFKGTFHGLVAGFLETGETLEECVRREVMEETGLTISNIRYFGSQPWPYPSGLMIGFTADYLEGNIKLQNEELTSGAFYRYDALPEIPRKLSMARMLIDDWLKKYSK